MTDDSLQPERSRWPHLCAVILACATFPLIWVGGLVTTYDAGMAVPDWPTTFGYNMFLYPLSTWLSGPWDLFIEHGHRLLGSFVGLCTIALNVAIWKWDKRKWMRYLGMGALLLVISQGVLGGLRVRLSSTDFARVHGVIGPLFFAVTIVLCVMTSRFWQLFTATGESGFPKKRAVISGWFLVLITYCQLVLGAHLRHPGINWSPSFFRTVVIFHVVVAFLVMYQTIQVCVRSRKLRLELARPAWLLVMLVLIQIGMGFAAWRAKYGWPSFVPIVAEAKIDQPFEIATHNALVGVTIQNASMSQAITVTGHVALGSLILATSVLYATRATYCYARQTNFKSVLPTESTPNNALSKMSAIGGAMS